MRIGRVYKIIAGSGNECYIGSTFNTLRDRFKVHKRTYKTYTNQKNTPKESLYCRIAVYDIFDKYGIDGCKIILIKEYSVVDRKHLEAYETLWMSKLRSINKNFPFSIRWLANRSYYVKNAEAIKERVNEYRIKNHEVIKEKKRVYRDQNKEIIREKRKKFYEDNKELKKKQDREYYLKNAEMLKQKSKEYRQKHGNEKIKCIICDCEVAKATMRRHEKTKKHLKNMQEN